MSFSVVRKVALGAIIASSISVAAWAACGSCSACNCLYYAHTVLHKQCKCITCAKAGPSMSPPVACCQTNELCISNPNRRQNYEIGLTHFNCVYGTEYSCVDISSQNTDGCCQ